MVTPLVLGFVALGAAPSPLEQWDRLGAPQAVSLLKEAIRFPTVQGNGPARIDQQAWLLKTATSLGLVAREAGLVTEIELPGPPGAPVLGLVVHGDVQPVEASAWKVPPFSGAMEKGYVVGRGAADDKGPLVQALLAMRALRQSAVPRTHTVRLLVGSDEESDNQDIKQYLATHSPPDLSLVLDSNFPVVVGEKAWNALVVSAPELAERAPSKLPSVSSLEAGLSPSIVPDRSRLLLRFRGKPDPVALLTQLRARERDLLPDTRMDVKLMADSVEVVVHGRAAHAGVNIEGGRNALVSMARAMDGLLPPSGYSDLLAFAKLAGEDLYGSALGIADADGLWGRASCAPTQVTTHTELLDPKRNGQLSLVVNIRTTPAWVGKKLEAQLFEQVRRFNERTGAHLVAGGFFGDVPLRFDPQSKVVRRLMADYRAATGRDDAPAISGGGTYAKRLPHAIAFGMWFPGKPYPGHDVDERVPVADLQAGGRVLTAVLFDLASSPPILEPFNP